MIPRLFLAHLPTPLVRPRRLADQLGIDLWVKRDDATGGPEAGNKVRKLEYLLADAAARGADTVLTCGGAQSNHARATALCAASIGMDSVLFLRAAGAPPPTEGNLLLDRMVGAEVRWITPAQYLARQALMDEAAAELRSAGRAPYIIPEGGSNGLGALGYVEAMREVRRQLDVGLAGGAPFDVIIHACGSGGTAAGVALGAAQHGVAPEVRPMVVQYDTATFETMVARIIKEARAMDPTLGEPARLHLDDRAVGPAYAESTEQQRSRILEAARLSGLLFDPVYTGKAFSGLWDLCEKGELSGKRVLFLHTGGLPGLLAQGNTFGF